MDKENQAYLAEAIATFALVFIGAGAVLANELSNGQIGLVGIALAYGLVLMCMVYATSHISGAHVNPAVTLGFWVTEKISSFKAIAYIVAQLIGALFAGFLLRVLFVNVSPELYLGTPVLGAGITFLGGIVVEAVLTFFLVFTIFGVIDKRAPPGIYGAAIGLVLTFDVLAGGVLTGAAMNPARAFGPAFAAGFWHNQLVYWIGPIIGGIIAAVVYNSFLSNKNGGKK
ncbi:MAG: MIP family channel protein [Candidatus Woesearchaeota archaeon]|jgi:MIP family channel proteins|nr:MIP family channel protein [Candidatus Woesearchaeota archaeon]